MSILRSDVDAGQVDFSDITAGEIIPPVSPGDVLLQEFMEPLGLSEDSLADSLKIPGIRISQIVRGTRAVTADTALRLGAFFGTTPQFWMNLQADYELQKAERTVGAAIRAEIQPLAQSAE